MTECMRIKEESTIADDYCKMLRDKRQLKLYSVGNILINGGYHGII